MDGVNEELMERLRKKFEVEVGAEAEKPEEQLLVTDKRLDELSGSLDSLKSEIILNRTAIEEIKAHVARIQIPPPEVKGEDIRAIDKKLDELSKSSKASIDELKNQVATIPISPPPAEVSADDIRAIDKKLDELAKSIESLRSNINFNRQSIEELKSHTVEIKTAFKPKPAEVQEKEAGEEDMEERFVISPKTGVIEKIKGKKIDYIEAKPSTLKKEERPKSKKSGIIEADDSTSSDKGGNLFKRLKDIK